MNLLTTAVLVLLALSGVVLCVAAIVAWRQPTTPARGAFVTVVLVAGLGALVLGGSLLIGTSTTVGTAVVLAFLLPVPWLRFTFEYTGRGGLNTSVRSAMLALPIAFGLLSTVGIYSTWLFPWLAQPRRDVVSGLVALMVYALTLLEGILLLYAGGLMLIGTAVILWTFHQYEHLDETSGMLFGVFGSVPWLSLLFGFQVNSANRLALPITVAMGFLVGAGAVGVLVYRKQAFRRLPAAGTIGPATVIRDLADVVVVTDGEGTVLDLNTAARRMLVGATSESFSADVTELLGSTPAELESGDTIELLSSEGRRLFDPTVSELTDQHGRRLGYAVTLRDVTDRTIREQRLEVLNRILRHNLRNDAMILTGYGQMLAEGVEEPTLVHAARTVVDTSERLVGFSENARDIDTLLAKADAEPRELALADLVRDVLEDLPTGVSREVDVPESLEIEVSRDLLKMALAALVENAVEHDDADSPHVTVRATHDPEAPYPVTLSVVDTGPGVPEMEWEVIQRGSETPLHHGNGLGLWLVRWAVTHIGGDLAIADNDPRGTVVSIRLPRDRRKERSRSGDAA